jgi:hypothetical protein
VVAIESAVAAQELPGVDIRRDNQKVGIDVTTSVRIQLGREHRVDPVTMGLFAPFGDAPDARIAQFLPQHRNNPITPHLVVVDDDPHRSRHVPDGRVSLLDDVRSGEFYGRIEQTVASAEVSQNRLDAHSGSGRDVAEDDV